MDKQNAFQRGLHQVSASVASIYSCVEAGYHTTCDYYHQAESAVFPSREYLYLVFGTLSIMVALYLLKRCQVNTLRNNLSEQEAAKASDDQKAEEAVVESINCCEKVTEEEFEHQARVKTR